MKTRQDMLNEAKAAIKEVTIQEVKNDLEKGFKPVLLDVRGCDEYQAGHLADSVHIPRGLLELEVEKKLPDKSRPVIVYCAGGVRSALAAQTLKEMGYNDVSSMLGGYDDWAETQYPVEQQAESREQLQALEKEVSLLEKQIEAKKRRLQSLK